MSLGVITGMFYVLRGGVVLICLCRNYVTGIICWFSHASTKNWNWNLRLGPFKVCGDWRDKNGYWNRMLKISNLIILQKAYFLCFILIDSVCYWKFSFWQKRIQQFWPILTPQNTVIRPKENIALFPAHRVTKKWDHAGDRKNIFFGKYIEINIVENSEFYFLGHNRLDKHVSNNQRPTWLLLTWNMRNKTRNIVMHAPFIHA